MDIILHLSAFCVCILCGFIAFALTKQVIDKGLLSVVLSLPPLA
jgi:hypothetical protein